MRTAIDYETDFRDGFNDGYTPRPTQPSAADSDAYTNGLIKGFELYKKHEAEVKICRDNKAST